MPGPTPTQVEHYVRMFEQLRGLPSYIGETMCWMVVRPHHAPLTVDEVVRRLGGDPNTMTTCRPADVGYEDDIVFVEQRGDAIIIVGFSPPTDKAEALGPLSQGATVHGVFWVINNFNRLYYVVDGVVVTELDALRPSDRWGSEPEALTDHLDALCDLDSSRPGTHQGHFPDWETAMATVESLTGLRLDADWFHRPQLLATINAR
jgi:hypothetical protein